MKNNLNVGYLFAIFGIVGLFYTYTLYEEEREYLKAAKLAKGVVYQVIGCGIKYKSSCPVIQYVTNVGEVKYFKFHPVIFTKYEENNRVDVLYLGVKEDKEIINQFSYRWRNTLYHLFIFCFSIFLSVISRFNRVGAHVGDKLAHPNISDS